MMDDYALIPLSKGFIATIDIEDEARVRMLAWHAVQLRSGHVYGQAHVTGSGRGGKAVYLHRFIVGALPSEVVDHDNGSTLDCRKKNLVRTTHKGNAANRVHHREIARLKALLDAHGIDHKTPIVA